MYQPVANAVVGAFYSTLCSPISGAGTFLQPPPSPCAAARSRRLCPVASCALRLIYGGLCVLPACLPACLLPVLHVSQYKLRLAGMGWFIGTLTYEQLSKFAVMSYPYAPRVLFLATEIMQQWQLLQQRRQQLSS